MKEKFNFEEVLAILKKPTYKPIGELRLIEALFYNEQDKAIEFTFEVDEELHPRDTAHSIMKYHGLDAGYRCDYAHDTLLEENF